MIPLRDTIPSRHVPVMTYALILANVFVFALELTLSPLALRHLTFICGVVPARHGIPWGGAPPWVHLSAYGAYLTSMFLHGGLFHIISNMWVLWIFGDNVEDRMGPLRFLLFYLLCGILANVANTLINPTSTVPTIGASGAIAGVLGAYFLMYPTAQVVVLVPILFIPFFFLVPAVFFLLIWFLIQLFSGTLAFLSPEAAGGIAWWAHVAGFLGGMVLYPFFVLRRRKPRRPHADEYGTRGAWSRR